MKRKDAPFHFLSGKRTISSKSAIARFVPRTSSAKRSTFALRLGRGTLIHPAFHLRVSLRLLQFLFVVGVWRTVLTNHPDSYLPLFTCGKSHKKDESYKSSSSHAAKFGKCLATMCLQLQILINLRATTHSPCTT